MSLNNFSTVGYLDNGMIPQKSMLPYFVRKLNCWRSFDLAKLPQPPMWWSEDTSRNLTSKDISSETKLPTLHKKIPSVRRQCSGKWSRRSRRENTYLMWELHQHRTHRTHSSQWIFLTDIDVGRSFNLSSWICTISRQLGCNITEWLVKHLPCRIWTIATL